MQVNFLISLLFSLLTAFWWGQKGKNWKRIETNTRRGLFAKYHLSVSLFKIFPENFLILSDAHVGRSSVSRRNIWTLSVFMCVFLPILIIFVVYLFPILFFLLLLCPSISTLCLGEKLCVLLHATTTSLHFPYYILINRNFCGFHALLYAQWCR